MSVVVPTLNESGWIGPTLERARSVLGGDAELIVVDGGSVDDTRDRAREAGATRVLRCRPGRGRQLNAGARAARGRVLLFLHADTRLEQGSREAILEAAAGGADLGCHRFGVYPPPRRFGRWSLLERAVNLRSRLFRTATGDQAIFATRSHLRRTGGFPDQPLFEDVGFVARSRRAGGRFRILPITARTSRRRWESAGFITTVLLHLGLRAGHALRIPPGRLAEWYREWSSGGSA